MRRRRRTRSISGPIILSSIAVVLTAALLVGWIIVISKNTLPQEWSSNAWLLVVGIVSFVTIIAVLVLFSVFLAREILEVRRQTTFVDSVTHELKSPLASIRLCLETMSRPELAVDQRNLLRDMMLGDVERLSDLIDDILQASRIEHGQLAHRVAAVDVPTLVRRTVSVSARRHRMLPEDVALELPEALTFMSDEVALELVLRNLVDNAIKYSDPPAHVRVCAQPTETGGLRLEVEDHGVGIPRHALKRVFERFYRVDEEPIRARRGTGLGLYVVSALVRNMGGRLRAHSEGPGRGTKMVVDLPRQAGADIVESVS